jgi:thiopeptide-type bacteriocin biosynthesis protein
MSGWVSAHLYFNGDIYQSECDALIRDVIAPSLKNLGISLSPSDCPKAFFVRYVDPGSHVRLRLSAPALRPLELMRAVAHTTAISTSQVRLRWREYEPELSRYGGQDAMCIAEEAFVHSTAFAFACLVDERMTARTWRLGRSVISTVALLHAFFRDAKLSAEICMGWGEPEAMTNNSGPFSVRRTSEPVVPDALIKTVQDLWFALSTRTVEHAATAAFHAAMTSTADALRASYERGQLFPRSGEPIPWYACLAALAGSHRHMTNNRLGVTVREEVRLASRIGTALAGLAQVLRVEHEHA